MILGFKPCFVAPILAGTKIHTIRDDPHNRWKAGREIIILVHKIHFLRKMRKRLLVVPYASGFNKEDAP
jgi:hypothetical protein